MMLFFSPERISENLTKSEMVKAYSDLYDTIFTRLRNLTNSPIFQSLEYEREILALYRLIHGNGGDVQLVNFY